MNVARFIRSCFNVNFLLDEPSKKTLGKTALLDLDLSRVTVHLATRNVLKDV